MATRVSLLKKSKSWVWLVLAGGVVGACIEIPERSPSVAAGGTSSINGGKGGSGNAPSSGGDGNTGNDASGGTETGTAGTTSGGAGATSGSGGTTIGNGGSESAGAGGGGAGGEETGGGGAGGAPTVSYCAGRFIALNDIAGDTLIDDFEDGDSNIYARDGRQGSWVLGELGTGTSTPAPGPLTPTVDGGYSDGKGIYVIGSGDPSWLLTITVPFVQDLDDCYDASVYTGITLLGAGNTNSAKTYGPVHLRVLTAAVMAKPVAERNFHQVEMDVDNLGIWIIYTYHWADFVQPNAAGAEAPLDPHDIIGLEVIAVGPNIEVAIDDVEFITD